MPGSIQSAEDAFLRGSLKKTWSLTDNKLTYYWRKAGGWLGCGQCISKRTKSLQAVQSSMLKMEQGDVIE